VAHDSSDVWVSPELFDLDQKGLPNFIAGVPPDYFSSTGQRWGNPLYLWEEHRRTGYDWWIRRIKALLTLMDSARMDHFRGFDRYYRIPASRPTAQGGRWVSGPKMEFFRVLSHGLGKALDELPIIAEDLGDDLGGAIKLREDLKLPGMIILQFAFGGSESERDRFDPGKHKPNAVVYTGTHDNNTILGWWYNDSTEHERAHFTGFVGKGNLKEPHWEMIRMGMESAAHTFIVPLQDVLGLGASARMNRPGVPAGQWRWRCTVKQMESAPWDRLKQLAQANGR
jgi:4-alpha-glucanotransferase